MRNTGIHERAFGRERLTVEVLTREEHWDRQKVADHGKHT